MAKKLLVINQYYPPDIASTGQYAHEICSGLVERGYEVHVVTAQPSYTEDTQKAPSYEVLDGVHVNRISLGMSRGRASIVKRIMGYLKFLRGGYNKSSELIRKESYDAIVTFHNPPFVSLLGAYLSKKFNTKFFYILHDINPDILKATNWKNIRLLPPILWVWEVVNRWVYRKANVIFVLGEGMRKTLIDKGVAPNKIHAVPIWAHPEIEAGPKEKSIREEFDVGEDELLLLYSGNMGVMHSIDSILDAARELAEAPVKFLFIGGGIRRKHLISRVEKEGLNIEVLPYQSEEKFVRLVRSSDACFVVLEPGMERLSLPSRAFTFLSAGKPLITCMSSEADIAKMVAEEECGWNIRNGSELAELVRYLLDNPQELAKREERGREVYYEKYSRDKIIDEYEDILREKFLEQAFP